MTEMFIVGDDEGSLSGSKERNQRVRFGSVAGLLLCGLAVWGAHWSQASQSRVGAVSNTAPSQEFSQAAECRLKTLVAQPHVLAATDESEKGLVAQSDPACGRTFAVAVPETENMAESSQKDTLHRVLAGAPMEALADSLASYAPTTRALAVGIAKQESDWGRQSPHKAGQDCYNYWGYKGNGGNGSVGGYACFDSPEEAVETVVGKINTLVQQGRTTPQQMLVWKCGSSCATHSPESVTRWVSVVEGYFRQLSQG